MIKALAKIGFQSVRQRGSHLIMKHPDGRSTVIPVHPGEELGAGNVDGDNERCGAEQEGVFEAVGALA